MNLSGLKELLDTKSEEYNQAFFIETDPVCIPHLFSLKEDQEISGFFSASIAWGQRRTIISNARKLMHLMDDSPYDFIIHHQASDLIKLKGFVHRTFQYDDLLFFISSLQNIYTNHGGLEQVMATKAQENNVKNALMRFRKTFFELEHLKRNQKHISDPAKNSACKRLNMFLRWMVRQDDKAVDLGIWHKINPSQLSCPLDIHSGNVARRLKLLTRKQNDWKAVEELDHSLRSLDPHDPVKYDFALFGLGVFEKWS